MCILILFDREREKKHILNYKGTKYCVIFWRENNIEVNQQQQKWMEIYF